MNNSNKEFESAMMKQLLKANMKEDLLKRISSSISNIYKLDILPERIWWEGQPSPDGFRVVDGIVVGSRIKLTDVEKLRDLSHIEELLSIEIFPKGIIRPEFLDVQVRLGDNVQDRVRNIGR